MRNAIAYFVYYIYTTPTATTTLIFGDIRAQHVEE